MAHTATTNLLAEVLEAHGGLQRWRDYKGMSSTIVTGGQLWGLKGIDMTPTPRVAKTEFTRQWTQIAPFGDPDWTMTWVPNHIVIEDSAGQSIAERDDARDSFAGHGYDTPWDPLQLAYFNGYAMWTYHALPFVFAEPGYEVTEVAPVIQDGKPLRGLHVRFPEGTHTHTREQRFYFSDDGLLSRHEYSVDVWADSTAAHLLSDYIEVEGFRLPTKRRVYPRNQDGSLQYDFNTVSIDMSNYRFH